MGTAGARMQCRQVVRPLDTMVQEQQLGVCGMTTNRVQAASLQCSACLRHLRV
jgi:hypothetical protein